jgi:WD40 repeat protein/serine/threonine protein kinase
MNHTDSERDPVEELAEDFLARHRRGERPSLTEYTERYPQHADDIRDLFPALVKLEQLKPSALEISDEPECRPPFDCLGDFRILREVGRGGMGVVYEAVQLSLGRHVALKVLPGQALLDSRKLLRFQREARSVARLHHSNIVPVHGVGEQDGTHYYVMQFIQGLGLDQVLDELRRLWLPNAKPRNGSSTLVIDQARATNAARSLISGEFTLAHDQPGTQVSATSSSSITLPGQSAPGVPTQSGRPYWRSVARIGLQVAEALSYAHAQGVLHRDIKPSNLLLDTHSTVWLTDFGLAKADSDTDDLTHSGDIVGTLRFMAPERFDGRTDARGDIYSLGLTLYELLTLRAAYGDSDGRKLIQRVLHEEPDPPRRINPSVPRDLETIVLKATAREPARRYQTAAAFADDLQRFLDDKPVRARPVGSLERLGRWCKRNPALAGLTSALLLALLLGVAGFAWKWREAVANAKDADLRRGEAVSSAIDADRQRTGAQRQLAHALFDRGLAIAEQGDAARGLHWMLEAHRQVPDDDLDFDRVIRSNLNAWRGQVHGLRQILGHPDRVNRAAFRADGAVVATACWDKRIRFWSTETGREEKPPLELPALINDLAFSPSGEYLAVGLLAHPDLEVPPFQIWELATRRCLIGSQAEVGSDRSLSVNVVTFVPAGDRVVAGYSDGTIRMWETKTAKQVGDTLKTAEGVRFLGMSPDGGAILSAGKKHDGKSTFRLLDANRLAPLGEEFRRPVECRSAGLRSDGRALLVEDSGEIWQQDVKSGERIGRGLPHPQRVVWAAYGPDGRSAITACGDRLTRVWDLWMGLPAGGVIHHDSIDVSVSPDGRLAVTCGGHDRTARIWQLARDPSRVASLPSFARIRAAAELPKRSRETVFPFHSSAFDSTVTRVVCRDGTGVASLLNCSDGWPIGPPWKPTLPCVRTVALSPDGRLAATASDFNVFNGSIAAAVNFWDADTGRLLPRSLVSQPNSPGPTNWVPALAFSSDSKYLAFGDYSGRVVICETDTAKPVGLPLDHDDIIMFLAFSPDGTRLAVGTANDHSRQAKLTLWSGASPNQLSRVAENNVDGRVLLLAFSPDGRRLLSADQGSVFARLWDATAGLRQIASLPQPEGLTAASFNGNAQLATGSRDGSVRLWDVETGRPLGPALPHSAAVTAIALSPDGHMLAVGDVEGGVRFWDVKAGRPLGPLVSQRAEILGVAFKPDGNSLRVIAADSTVRTWVVPESGNEDFARLALRLEILTGEHLDAGQAVVPLTAEEWNQRCREWEKQEGTVARAHDSPIDAKEWHDARARDAEQDEDSFGAAWHLSKLIELNKSEHVNWRFYARRALALAGAGKFKTAEMDANRAAELAPPGVVAEWEARQALYLEARGNQSAARWYRDRITFVQPR